ncbi:MAG: phosphotransferase, partial [Butyrivibrio sp.]|nr:phosphotransferase [Butyrivibrio sp.]
NPKIFVSNGADVQNTIADLSRKLATLQRQQQMLCKLSEKWVTEAVFGEGYYHGDLHSGNIMLDSHRLTVIDFGNATKLDKFQQEKITMMLMAAAAGSGSGFMEGFTALLGEDSIKLLETKKDELQAVFSEVMKLGDYHSSAERIAAALVRAQKLGFELPPAIYGFQQCQIRLMNTLDSFNKEVIEMQKILRQLQAAQNATILDVKSEFDKTINEDAGAAGNMKIAVLSDKEEDLRPLLKSRNEGVRKSLENIFHEDFDSLATLLSQDPSILVNSTLSSERMIKQQYGIVGSNFFDISKFYQVLTDHGFNMQNDGRSPQQQVQDYAAHFDEIPYEEKLGIATEILHIYSEFNILGALRALWKAQDEGKNEEELKALEDIVIQRIGHTKQSYLERAESQLVARIEELYDGVEVNDLAQRKQRDKEKGESYYNLDKIFANVKTKLRVPANLPQAEEELKPFFADPIYGQRLKEAFDAYKAAPADAPNKEELLNNFVEAYRMPVFISFGESRKGSAMFAIDYDDPKTFVDVMGDVIDVKYREALKRVSFFKSVKYGFRIQGDIQKRNLTTTEFIKMMLNRMRGNDL